MNTNYYLSYIYIINSSYTTISPEYYIFFINTLKDFSTNISISLVLHIVFMSKNIIYKAFHLFKQKYEELNFKLLFIG